MRVHLLHHVPKIILEMKIVLDERCSAKRTLAVINVDCHLVETTLAENMAAPCQDGRFVEDIQTNHAAMIFLHCLIANRRRNFHVNPK
jgi:hypothetical protein